MATVTADWPFVLVELSERGDDDDATATFRAMQAGLDSGRRFAVLIALPDRMPEGGLRRDPEWMRWLKQHRPEISVRCAAIASASSNPELRPDPARAERAWGCPSRGFGTIAEARRWALALLDPGSAGAVSAREPSTPG